MLVLMKPMCLYVFIVWAKFSETLGICKTLACGESIEFSVFAYKINVFYTCLYFYMFSFNIFFYTVGCFWLASGWRGWFGNDLLTID